MSAPVMQLKNINNFESTTDMSVEAVPRQEQRINHSESNYAIQHRKRNAIVQCREKRGICGTHARSSECYFALCKCTNT